MVVAPPAGVPRDGRVLGPDPSGRTEHHGRPDRGRSPIRLLFAEKYEEVETDCREDRNFLRLELCDLFARFRRQTKRNSLFLSFQFADFGTGQVKELTIRTDISQIMPIGT